jgi:16S rRNA (guanine527-N7)-methyltransferase
MPTDSARRRLAELARQHALDDAATNRLETLLDALASHRLAATTVRESDRAIDVHVADSLTGLEIEGLRNAGSLADIGSGAGLPGLPLAAAVPGAHVTLIESHFHKCTFLQAAVRRMGLENASIARTRAEEWTPPVGGLDAALARAVAAQPVVIEYAAPLLRMGGVLVDWRGARTAGEEAASLRAAAAIGLELREIRSVEPFPGARDRHLHVFEKVAVTPDRFPRRAGAARKRPLG